jgi:hypothetical protein
MTRILVSGRRVLGAADRSPAFELTLGFCFRHSGTHATHLHNSCLDGCASRDVEIEGGSVVSVLYETNKFGLFDRVKGLITSDNIFCKERVEHFLGEIALVCQLKTAIHLQCKPLTRDFFA